MKFNVNKIITETVSEKIVNEFEMADIGGAAVKGYKKAEDVLGGALYKASGLEKHDKDVNEMQDKAGSMLVNAIKKKKSALASLPPEEPYTPPPSLPTPETDDYGPAAGLALVGGLGAYALSKKSKK